MYRSHHLNQLGIADVSTQVHLAGWVHRRRDHGGIIFIDLRDREGLTQIVFDPSHDSKSHQTADSVKLEFVIKITGNVRRRPADMINPKIGTGEIEVLANNIEILNAAKTPPFEINQDKDLNEELRLKFRYLDLRRERLKNNIITRHRIIKFIRDYFDTQGFLEIETPILLKGTPEGSREYLVPSRLYPGKFYVLPQSPQQLKQLLMVAGFDKYFQIARCFRDEDQRGDRQPEFTQLDIEMSFVTVDDVLKINEQGLIKVTEKFQPNKKIIQKPFPRLTWQQAMEEYGSDKPDIRFEMKLSDLNSECQNCGFQVFENILKKDGVVKALRIPKGAKLSRSQIAEFEEIAKKAGATGLAYLTLEGNSPKSPILKYFTTETIQKILEKTNCQSGDLVFFAADKFETACNILGQVRLAAAKRFQLIPENVLAYLWVTDFPLFEWNQEENKLVSSHHPFTHPKPEDLHLLDSSPEKVRALAYDIVMNGIEIGGGSIRIHGSTLQSKIFDLLKITKEDAERRFGHLLRAFEYGAPPHGGIAWGLDRLIMLFQNEPNIREVIAFPKDQKARDLMSSAPGIMPQEQIAEVHIQCLSSADEGIFGLLQNLFKKHHIWHEIIENKAIKTNQSATKALLLKNETGYIIAVISATSKINFEKLKKIVKTNRLEVASEEEFEAITECEKDSLPPLGNLFNLPTYIDADPLKNEIIVFPAGNKTQSLKMKSADYLKVSEARLENFTA